MPYLDSELRLGVNSACPSLDAARCLGDRIAAAEADLQAMAVEISAAQFAEAAIDAIAQLDFSPAVAARLVLKIRNRCAAATWSHFEHADTVLDHLDDAHDSLESV